MEEEKKRGPGKPRLPAGESVRIPCTVRFRRSKDSEILDALLSSDNRSDLIRKALRFYFLYGCPGLDKDVGN